MKKIQREMKIFLQLMVKYSETDGIFESVVDLFFSVLNSLKITSKSSNKYQSPLQKFISISKKMILAVRKSLAKNDEKHKKLKIFEVIFLKYFRFCQQIFKEIKLKKQEKQEISVSK